MNRQVTMHHWEMPLYTVNTYNIYIYINYLYKNVYIYLHIHTKWAPTIYNRSYPYK